MADSEVLKTLKDVPFRIQSASLKERRRVVQELENVLSASDVPDAAVRVVCRCVGLTLHRYHDGSSRSLVRRVLHVLLARHLSVALPALLAVLRDHAAQLRATNTSLHMARASLEALRWAAMVAAAALRGPEDLDVDYSGLVLMQGHLLAAATAYGGRRVNEKAFTILEMSWAGGGGGGGVDTVRMDRMVMALVSQPSDAGPHVCLVLAALTARGRHRDLLAPHQENIMERFIKSLISARTRPQAEHVTACASLLTLGAPDVVQRALLPALHKAMLRAPETCMQTVHATLLVLPGPLHATHDVSNTLIANLLCKDETVRTWAARALGALAARVDAAAARALLDHAYKQYHGTAANRANTEDKMNVLQGVGMLRSSLDAVTSMEREQLVLEVCRQTLRVMEGESHERTLLEALHALHQWLDQLLAIDTTSGAGAVLPAIVDIVKKCQSCKSCTGAVRCACLSLLARALQQQQGSSNPPAVDLVAPLLPALEKAVEKAIQQSLQTAVVSEGVSSMLVLVLVDASLRLPQCGHVWPALVSSAPSALLHDRVLHAVNTPDVLTQVVWLCVAVCERYSTESAAVARVQRALVLCMLWPARSVRDAALQHVRALLAASHRADTARALLAVLCALLDAAVDRADLTGNIILDAVNAITSFTEYPREAAETLALAALPACHHPAATATNRRAWERVTRRLRIDPRALLAAHAAVLRDTYITRYTHTRTNHNVLACLMAVESGADADADTGTGALAASAVHAALHTLHDQRLLDVTRDEYFTFLTPDGELYDKSVLPGNDEGMEMNLKRESKAYSYAEQLEELQLRRELAERRRVDGSAARPQQLTAKQRDALAAQLHREQRVRERLQQLDSSVEVSLSLLRGVQRGSPAALGVHARRVVHALLHALRSPLAASKLLDAICELRETLLPQHAVIGDSVARTTVRLMGAQCSLPAAWEQEPLHAAARRTVHVLHAATVAANAALTAPGFCYVFPLLKLALNVGTLRADDATLVCGLNVIAHHATSHSNSTQAARMPIDHMFRLLIDLIGSTEGRVQSACTAALLETAACAAHAPLTADDVTCLLAGLQSPADTVRDAALRALRLVAGTLPALLEDIHNAMDITKRLYIATFDTKQDNKQLAEELWSILPLAHTWSREETLVTLLVQEIQHPAEPVQRAAAAALAARVPDHGVQRVLDSLHAMYSDKLPMIPAKLDQFGHEVEAAVDEWTSRRGVALALHALASRLTADTVPLVMRFYVERGLGDRSEGVREEMLNAAMATVDLHGKETLNSQLPVFENFLDKAPKSSGYDAVRQSVVLLVGSLARHLDPEDPRLKPITLRMVQALSTPSQQVQEAVANCLPHLVVAAALQDDIPNIVNKLVKQLLTADKYGDRKGAAYGIAGIIKGLGIRYFKQLDVMGKLMDAIQEKKNYKYREGALFGFEMLCNTLGRQFEPYIVYVLPHLLLCFGDQSQYVRAAADDTARMIMSRLSAHGVKLILPSLLQALEDDNWRTKAGSIEMLGTMAYCAPKQLSSCLPSIVPKLIEVLSDSHMRVQQAGAEALKVIGSVIRNPEIQAIVPTLLSALQDPSNKTSACLQTLLDTKFVHFIDAPSLALMMPVVQRAFLDRSTETRKMAAQIIGNMYSLTDQKDLQPYLPNIMPGLKSSLLDPVPEVRSVSARALGAMVKGMGEASFEELLPWLMHTLTSEASSVDRSGAAQGLSEVVAGLGEQKLHNIMPDIIATAERTDIAPHVKDGYIMMFIYMPGAFTDEFTPYIGQIINPILKALADENEYVRETALKAGQRIVTLYADSAITLLLPELERGLFDDNWRIRYSSVQLLGDLLYRISGVSGKMTTETASEDDNFGTEQSHRAIMAALGAERRNRVLSGLYMGRSDVALMVRQAALHVWKVVVTNTPKTLREILPTLFTLLIGCLASTSYDKRQVAARTLGDLVRKLGERVLPEIVPILEEGLQSDHADQRQGVCIGLSEILASTSRDAVLSFADGLVPTVRTALCDPLPAVRAAAARTFDSLHATIGTKALDDILPPLLQRLDDPDPVCAEAALDSLKQIMAIKSRAVLPYLIPVLTAGVVDTRALSALAAAAGSALTRHLPRVLPALLGALHAARGTQHEARELEHCRDALLPVTDPQGVRCIIETLLECARGCDGGAGAAGGADGEDTRRAGAALLCAVVTRHATAAAGAGTSAGGAGGAGADLTPHTVQLLRGLLLLHADTERDIVQVAWEALNALTKSMDTERLIAHVGDVRAAVRAAAALAAQRGHDRLPGFCLPKGIAPILPHFRDSILHGLPEDKEAAALLLGEVIQLTSPAALQPSVVNVTGPLIRILGDRFTHTVKAAVLDTLAQLLQVVGVMLKQFLPQLQTTFLKALQDTHRSVRIKAGLALAQLVHIHTRADPLFVELHNGLRHEDPAVRDTMLHALRHVLVRGGDKMTEPLALQLLATLTAPAMLAHPDDPPRAAIGGCVGALLHALPAHHCDAAILHHVLASTDDWLLQHGRVCALIVALKQSPHLVYREQYEDKIDKALVACLGSEHVQVACCGLRGLAFLVLHLLHVGRLVPHHLLMHLIRSMNHQSNEMKQLAATAMGVVGVEVRDVCGEGGGGEVMRALLPALVNGTKERNTLVKANSELALRQVLRLHHDEHFYQECCKVLEAGAREALTDVVARALRRVHAQHDHQCTPDHLDCTIIT